MMSGLQAFRPAASRLEHRATWEVGVAAGGPRPRCIVLLTGSLNVSWMARKLNGDGHSSTLRGWAKAQGREAMGLFFDPVSLGWAQLVGRCLLATALT